MKSEIWDYYGEYKCHVKTRENRDKMLRWKGAKDGGVYYIPHEPNEYDVIVPRKYLKQAKKLLRVTKLLV